MDVILATRNLRTRSPRRYGLVAEERMRLLVQPYGTNDVKELGTRLAAADRRSPATHLPL
jgi:hypothetical protein